MHNKDKIGINVPIPLGKALGPGYYVVGLLYKKLKKQGGILLEPKNTTIVLERMSMKTFTPGAINGLIEG